MVPREPPALLSWRNGSRREAGMTMREEKVASLIAAYHP
jgi:hypothetical protein